MTKPNAKARAQRKYEAQYRDPIQVKAGESVEVEVDREDAAYPGWLWCRARDGRQGWMPVELLSRQRPFAIVLEDYSAKELTVQPGDELEIEKVRHGWALVRNAQGELGWIPQSHIQT
jgi:SH3-like domain-containing protein